MKLNKSVIWSLILLTSVAALYRIIPNRPWGFAPQWAMAIFAGAVIKDKKWAFVLPVLSMLLSDILYQILYANGQTAIYGFYKGQWLNYLLFASVTFVGFFIKKINIPTILIASVVAPTYFFIVSNFLTWAGVGEYVEYPKTLGGLMSCYFAGLPFYKMSIIATVVFCGILFGTNYLLRKNAAKTVAAH